MYDRNTYFNPVFSWNKTHLTEKYCLNEQELKSKDDTLKLSRWDPFVGTLCGVRLGDSCCRHHESFYEASLDFAPPGSRDWQVLSSAQVITAG